MIIIHSENITDASVVFYNTPLNKDVYIPFTYENGEYTYTFTQYYSTDETNRINGVLLKDINELEI